MVIVKSLNAGTLVLTRGVQLRTVPPKVMMPFSPTPLVQLLVQVTHGWMTPTVVSAHPLMLSGAILPTAGRAPGVCAKTTTGAFGSVPTTGVQFPETPCTN